MSSMEQQIVQYKKKRYTCRKLTEIIFLKKVVMFKTQIKDVDGGKKNHRT